MDARVANNLERRQQHSSESHAGGRRVESVYDFSA